MHEVVLYSQEGIIKYVSEPFKSYFEAAVHLETKLSEDATICMHTIRDYIPLIASDSEKIDRMAHELEPYVPLAKEVAPTLDVINETVQTVYKAVEPVVNPPVVDQPQIQK